MTLMRRRDFLKTAGGLALATASLSSGCKKSDHHIGPLKVVFIDEPREEWENVNHMIDNSLEGGFSFDFRDLKGEGLRFGNLVDIDGEKHALDAQGYSFSSRFQDQEKTFTLTSLRKNEEGFTLDIMENSSSLAFQRRGEMQRVVLDGKTYDLALSGLILPEERSDFYIPFPIFTVNGEEIVLSGGAGQTDDLFMALKLNPYYEKGVIEVLLGHNYFKSCIAAGEDVSWKGLEHIISLDRELSKKVNANYFNGEIQEDAYFRIDSFLDSKKKEITLNAADKIRVPDADPSSYPPFVTRYPTTHEIELRAIDKDGGMENHTSSPTLEGSFLFSFSPHLEARLDLPREGTGLVPELFNKEFEIEGKTHMFRYVAFDAGKVPKNRQPSSFGINYPPINGFLMEILEEPQKLTLSINEQKSINVDGKDYLITLKRAERIGFIDEEVIVPTPIDVFVPTLEQVERLFHGFDYILEIEKEGLKEERKIKVLAHGYSNRILDVNIDPDVAYYYGASNDQIPGGPQKFFISKNKFSSALDFSSDHRFSGLRKILIPDYDGIIRIANPVNDGVNTGAYTIEMKPTGKAIYQQVTLANRFNGEIEESFSKKDFGFRVDAEFGVGSYEGSKRKPDAAGYIVRPTRGFDYADQIKNGFILKIKSIERAQRRISI